MAVFQQTKLSYFTGISMFLAGAWYLYTVFLTPEFDLEMVQFSCRGSPGSADAYVTGTLRNITKSPIELYIEIELYLDNEDFRLINAEIEGGHTLMPGKYVRFDAIAPGVADRVRNCGIRFTDGSKRPVFVKDRTHDRGGVYR